MTTAQPRRRRHSPAVYRRRRTVLLVGVLLVIALIWLLIAQPWRGWASEQATADPGGSSDSQTQPDGAATELPVPEAPQPSPTPSVTPPVTPTASPSPSASSTVKATAKSCLATDLLVEAVTDQDTYGAGQNPKLSIRLTNQGADDCSLNVGTTTQAFTIMSGTDTWWRSTDCQSAPSDAIVLLAAGQTVSSVTPLTWDRTRSAVKTCADANRPSAPGGGASYHLSVSIGGVDSTDTKQFLLY